MLKQLSSNWRSTFAVLALATPLMAQTTKPAVTILLPERTRLLQGQMLDLVVEVRNANNVSGLKAMAGQTDLTAKFGAAVKADLDCDASSDWVMRANLQSFNTPGDVKLDVSVVAEEPRSATREQCRYASSPCRRGRAAI